MFKSQAPEEEQSHSDASASESGHENEGDHRHPSASSPPRTPQRKDTNSIDIQTGTPTHQPDDATEASSASLQP